MRPERPSWAPGPQSDSTQRSPPNRILRVPTTRSRLPFRKRNATTLLPSVYCNANALRPLSARPPGCQRFTLRRGHARLVVRSAARRGASTKSLRRRGFPRSFLSVYAPRPRRSSVRLDPRFAPAVSDHFALLPSPPSSPLYRPGAWGHSQGSPLGGCPARKGMAKYPAWGDQTSASCRRFRSCSGASGGGVAAHGRSDALVLQRPTTPAFCPAPSPS